MLHILIFLLLSTIHSTAFEAILIHVHTTIEHSSTIAKEFDVIKAESQRLPDSTIELGILIKSAMEIEKLKQFPLLTIQKTQSYSDRERQLQENFEETQTSYDFEEYSCFRTVYDTYSSMLQLQHTFDDLATLSLIGSSYLKTVDDGQGSDIPVLILTSDKLPPEQKPQMILTGGQHSRELAPPETVLRWAEHLLQTYDSDPESTMILDRTIVHIIPILNPDGREIVQDFLEIYYRKNAHPSGCHYWQNDGVDLNRNYPFYHGNQDGASDNPCNDDFFGSGPLSEPESKSLFDYCRKIFNSTSVKGKTTQDAFDRIDEACPTNVKFTHLYLDVHSYGKYIYFPYGFDLTAYPPNTEAITLMASKLSWFEKSKLWGPGQDGFLYTVSGDATDAIYGQLCVPSYGFEIGTDFYESCEYFENTLLGEILPSFTFAVKTAKNGYLIPLGPDVTKAFVKDIDGCTLFLEATIGNYDWYFVRNVPIAAAYVYINAHPDDVTQEQGIKMKLNQEGTMATIELDACQWEKNLRYSLYVIAMDQEGYYGTVMPLFATKP